MFEFAPLVQNRTMTGGNYFARRQPGPAEEFSEETVSNFGYLSWCRKLKGFVLERVHRYLERTKTREIHCCNVGYWRESSSSQQGYYIICNFAALKRRTQNCLRFDVEYTSM